MIEVPQQLNSGRYLTADRLGQGGMAVVHKCWDESLGILRAVKFLLPELAQSKRARQRFQAEAHAMARVEHPNVLRVYDVGEADGMPFLVSEYAPGGSLENWSALHGKMPPRLAVDVARQICRGVGAAHDEGIIHRDIKPDNVLVSRKGICKVTDFGIAQVVDSESMTRTGSAMGTLAYMAPEQKKDAKNIGPTADVYSIGATLWSLLTGEVPMDLFMSVQEDDALVDVPEPLRPVIRKAVSWKPAERYPDTPTMLAALTEVLAELPPDPPDTPSLITRKVETITERPTSVPSTASLLSSPTMPSRPSVPSDAQESDGQPTIFPDESAARAGQPLPYFMPAQAVQPGPENPDWVAEEDLEREKRKQEALAKLQAIRQRQSSEGTPVPTRPSARTPVSVARAPHPALTPPPAATAPSAIPRDADVADDVAEAGTEFFVQTVMFAINPLKWAVVPLFGLVLVAGGYLGYATYEMRKAANVAHAATDGLFASIEAEARVIDDLKEIGAQWQLPDAHRIRLPTVPEKERVKVAMEYLKVLHEQKERFLYTAPPQAAHRATMAVERIERLDKAVGRYQEAMLAWERAADSQQGRTVCGLRMADCP